MPARAYHAAVYWELGQRAMVYNPEEARVLQEKAAAEMGEIRKVIPKPATERKGTTPFKDLLIRQHLQETWSKAEEIWRRAQEYK
jgi:hypothetical protein